MAMVLPVEGARFEVSYYSGGGGGGGGGGESQEIHFHFINFRFFVPFLNFVLLKIT